MLMNRQEMLSAISYKIARTWWGTWPWETGYYLPVMIGDFLQYLFDSNRTYDEVMEMIVEDNILSLWDNLSNPLHKEWDNIVTYIYNLL